MRYLGVDYGKRKIGLAVSDGQIASIYKVLETRGLEDSIRQVKEVISKEDIQQVVVGIPESGEAKKLVEKFIAKLKDFVSIIKVDETLSSINAKKLMVDLGVKDRGKEDAYSAALILQNFLDSLN